MIDFIHGNFKRPLKPEVRELWVKFMYCMIMILGVGLMAVFLQVLSWASRCINFIYWGISMS